MGPSTCSEGIWKTREVEGKKMPAASLRGWPRHEPVTSRGPNKSTDISG